MTTIETNQEASNNINQNLISGAGYSDHSPPEFCDHLPAVVNICNHVAYIFELQTGRKWSRLPAFAHRY